MILKNGFQQQQQQQQDNKDTFVHPHKLSRLISIRNRTISIYNCKHTSYSLSLCSSLTYTTGYLRRKTCHGGCCACVNVHFVLFVFINLFLKSCCGQLLINVQNQGGEVIQESITSNVSEDVITLEFQKTDGTLITQIIDFRNEVRILKALVLGEEERGQSLYQVMCFVTKFIKGDFISSDAMAKLRQKNPSTIRIPEEDKGKEAFIMTSWVHLNRSMAISRHLMTVCSEALDATYIRNVDLKAWAELPGSSISNLEAATEKFPDTLTSRCSEVTSLWAPCLCSLETCIGWYPCGLKYCKGKQGDSSAAAQTNYRCGIKTCRKCSQFTYYVRQKQLCLWDE